MLPPPHQVLKLQQHHLLATRLFSLPSLSTWAMPEITLDGGGGGGGSRVLCSQDTQPAEGMAVPLSSQGMP